MMSFIRSKIPNQPKEKYYGNREYKYYLVFDKFKVDDYQFFNDFDFNTSNSENNSQKINKSMQLLKNNNINKINKRATQLLFRLNEGNGKATYLIGVKDNGETAGIPLKYIIESYWYLVQMCKLVNANIKSFRIYQGNKNFVGTCRIILNDNYSIF